MVNVVNVVVSLFINSPEQEVRGKHGIHAEQEVRENMEYLPS